MLNDVDFESVYASGTHEPAEFYLDALVNSNVLDLGLGYFSSSGFRALSLGFAYFIKQGGTMRIMINHVLSEDDKLAILEGQKSDAAETIEEEFIDDVLKLDETLSKKDIHFFRCLSFLISSGRLEIKATIPKRNKQGIVHQKFGLFKDCIGNQLAFSGSVNFSANALCNNVENLSCDFSWDDYPTAKKRILYYENLFLKAWTGISEVVEIVPIERTKVVLRSEFPIDSLDELLKEEYQLLYEELDQNLLSDKYKQKINQLLSFIKIEVEKSTQDNSSIKSQLNKWRHQEEAISRFIALERGVLNMATGTGKTRTSLKICEQLIFSGAIHSIVISCDGTDLLNQWYNELLKLVTTKNISWSILRQYSGYHQSERFRNSPRKKVLLTSRQQLHLALNKLGKDGEKTLLIHDEVHKLGSVGNQERLQGLSNSIRYRLGLSATPEREYDEEGTQFITEHIGPIIYEFTLEDAIKRGILSPFNYHPVEYQLTQNDRRRLKNIWKRKAASEKEGTPMPEEEFRNEIARVYKTAEGKIPAFSQFIGEHPEMLKKCVVFVETKEYGEQILEIVHRYRSDFHSYFGGDDSFILQRFSRGEIECLLTCHRISEGIDIPSITNIILLSSARARLETIQRIGRCLRYNPKNTSKVASVVDFIRHNDNENDNLTADEERQQFLQHLASIRTEKMD